MAMVKRLIGAGAILALGAGFLLATRTVPEAQPLTTGDVSTRLAAFGERFKRSVTAGPLKTVPCILSGGTETTCVSITVPKAPARSDIGPWCPKTISDGADAGGIWLDKGEVHDVSGAFIAGLATFYEDDFWQVADPATGAIRVTDTRESCDGAARPDVDPKYFNHCVECQTSYLEDGATATFVIPLRPVFKPAKGGRIGRGGAGVTFGGVRLDGPAPVDAILAAHTIAPFDDCGGHVNLHAGYHVHAVTECYDGPAEQGHAPMIGVAMDGAAIHARSAEGVPEPDDLDACGGHQPEGMDYHYHAGPPGDNAILGCHAGETGCALDETGAGCDASGGVLGRITGLFRG